MPTCDFALPHCVGWNIGLEHGTVVLTVAAFVAAVAFIWACYEGKL